MPARARLQVCDVDERRAPQFEGGTAAGEQRTELNERPRKTLGWARPADLFTLAVAAA
jgi:hypothetical protein